MYWCLSATKHWRHDLLVVDYLERAKWSIPIAFHLWYFCQNLDLYPFDLAMFLGSNRRLIVSMNTATRPSFICLFNPFSPIPIFFYISSLFRRPQCDLWLLYAVSCPKSRRLWLVASESCCPPCCVVQCDVIYCYGNRLLSVTDRECFCPRCRVYASTMYCVWVSRTVLSSVRCCLV